MHTRWIGLAGVMVLGVGLTLAWGQPAATELERVELGVVLRQLNSVGTFMMATAHPDDENNGLLALLAKGQGHRTVLVTATRGDGGQNEIGPELFDALAVLRTEELLAAHRIDGAEQYFTRAVDFGYSFSREETFEQWGRDEILADFVRMIRTVRPDVVTALSPEGEDGGQHHQASAILAHEAYLAAGDPSRFPEQLEEGLRPWQPRKFYFSAGFGFGFRRQRSTEGMTAVDLSGYDPLLGRTYAELGSLARSMHKCQGMSPLVSLPGQASAFYRLAESTLPGETEAGESGLFDGIETTIDALAQFAGPSVPVALETELHRLAALVRDVLGAFESGRMDDVRAGLASGLAVARGLRSELGSLDLSEDAAWEIDFRLKAKEEQLERAMVLAYGVQLQAWADDGVVVPGQDVSLVTMAVNHGDDDLQLHELRFDGFAASESRCPAGTVEVGAIHRCDVDMTIPTDASPTSIHWTHEPGLARYRFDPSVEFGVPFRPTPFTATFIIELSGMVLERSRPILHRYGDDIFAGEKRTALQVVPRLSVDMSPDIAVVPRRSGASRELRVTVTNAWPGSMEGVVGLDLPDGWAASPRTAPVQFDREDEARTVRFLVTPGETDIGERVISAFVEASGARYELGYQAVEYPHIGRRHLVRPAQSAFEVLDVQLREGLRVGYVEGVGDAVPQAIEQLGASLERIGPDELAWGDLSRFDVIVTGVRAYERRSDLRANNDRLLQYVEAGGTLIVQYNKFEFNEAQYGPYAAVVSRDRVTAEDAPVRVLAGDHPVFRRPNPIGPSTWDHWVQERGLYFLGERDPAYVDLVELEDTFAWNAGVKRGALVEARYGTGRWIYVGLGLWRQLPAGTPGAYLLLANLLSLGAGN